MPRHVRHLLVLAAASLAAQAIWPAAAGAHASLVSTDPGDGSTVPAAPDQVTVVFDEPVEADDGDVRLHDADGRRVAGTELDVQEGGRVLRLAVPGLDDGGYVVAWGVVSEDGHPITGAVSWQLGRSAPPVDPAVVAAVLDAERGSEAVDLAAGIARWLVFAGLLVLLGSLVALARSPGELTRSPGVRVVPVTAWAAAFAGTVAGLGLFAADLAGGGLGDAFSPAVVADSLGTESALLTLTRAGLLAGVLPLVLRPRPASPTWIALAGAALAVLLLTVTLAGHARAGRWVVLAAVVDLVHLAAAGVWLGGLAVVLVLLAGRRPDRERQARLRQSARRFSRLALPAVAVVVLTGGAQSLRQVQDLAEIRETDFGRLLLAKVIAVGVLVVLAALSRSAVRAGDDDLGRLRQSVGAEAAVAVAVLGLTAALVVTDPTPPLPPSGFQATTVVDGVAIEAVVAPARRGPVDVHLYVEAPGGGLTGAGTATGRFTHAATGEAVGLRFARSGRNHFSAIAVSVPRSGRWRLEVAVVAGDLGERTAAYDVDVR